jgi:hypothetical protein
LARIFGLPVDFAISSCFSTPFASPGTIGKGAKAADDGGGQQQFL